MNQSSYVVGIDSGSQNTKAVLLKDGAILKTAIVSTDFDALAAAEKVYASLLEQAGIPETEVGAIVSTGASRNLISFATGTVNEIIAAAIGTHDAVPEARMLLDMGTEASRAILLDENGAAKSYEVNDRCASGAGTFIETVARALQLTPEEMGEYSQRADKDIAMQAQCVVFVESEVISLIHQRESRENIARGVHLSICNRLHSMFLRLGIEQGVAFIGGPSRNAGLVDCLSLALNQPVIVPEHSAYISAVGAALSARKDVEAK